MRRVLLFAFLVWPALLGAQSALPIRIGETVTMLPPAVDASGRTVVFGSAVAPEGTNLGTLDLYAAASDGSALRRLTKLPGNNIQQRGAYSVSVSANGTQAAFNAIGFPTTSGPYLPPIPSPTPGPAPPVNYGPIEEVHVIDVATGSDRVVAADQQGCIQPLASVCFACFFTCVHAPHISADGAKVLYSVSRNQPFYIVNSDGSASTHLPVYTGALAPAPQRVISRNGLVAFTSSAPFGPTFAASATDVYVMNLDGSNIQNVTKFGSDSSQYSFNATISADGSSVAFEGYRNPSVVIGGAVGVIGGGSVLSTNQIWLARTDGSSLLALTTGSDAVTQPSISGNGSIVAFISNGQVATATPLTSGVALKILTKFQTSMARDPVISEDGSTIVFDIGPPNGNIGALYAINTDGTNLRPVYAPRSLNQNGVTGITFNAAPSPGSLFSIYGLNLSGDIAASATGFPLPNTLAGLTLLVNGIPTPLVAVSPWQVNAQLPSDLFPGPAAFQLRFADGFAPTPVAADVKSVSPAIFLLPPASLPPAPGPAPGVVVSVISPPLAAAFHAQSGIPADQAHPAVAGEILEIYGTGLGQTDIFVPAGQPAPGSPPARTFVTPQVLIGNTPARVVFSGLTPGLAGVYQVNAVVPAGLRPGFQTLSWRTDNTTVSSSGTIVVK